VSAFEHDWEPIRGLPERLPPGETLLWQGAPDWRRLAMDAFHLRAAGLYLLGGGAGGVLLAGEGWEGLLAAAPYLALAGAVGGAILCGLAWAYAASTVYTITSKRVVIRFGLAIPKAVNLPFARIESAALKLRRGGLGDLPLRLHRDQRAGWLHLWPFVRPGRFAQPEPMLRAVAQAEAVAALLARALRQEAALRGAAVASPAPTVRPASPGALPEAARA
jgi:hypothetical protein